MITAKFGGTSVADAGAIERLAAIVGGNRDVRVVVVSALAGVTDRLIASATAATRGDRRSAAEGVAMVRDRHLVVADALRCAPATMSWLMSQADRLQMLVDALATLASVGARDVVTPAPHDAIVATGELLSSRIVADALKQRNVDAAWIDARQAIVTDRQHTRAAPLEEQTNAQLRRVIGPEMAAGRVSVVGGFVGATEDGITTTLGRGGSDYSAAIIGAALDATEIQIWTDVDGMLTADPRILPAARVVPHLSFAEASELAYFGAKVLHPSTLLPAIRRDIPVRILNSRRPDVPGTLITARAPASLRPLRAIACKRDVTVIDITSTRMLMAHGFLRRVFEVFDRHATAVDVVTTSEVSVSVTIDDAQALDRIVEALGGFADVSCERGLALVCVVGENLRMEPALCADVLGALAGLPLRIVSQAGSRQNITLVLAQSDLNVAVQRLHHRFFESVEAVGVPPAATQSTEPAA
jgi:aspartate kinase